MLSYIEISKKNLNHNVKLFRNILGSKTKLVGVVKANAYGHGVKEVVSCIENKVDYFQVDDYLEFKEVVKLTKKPILILGYVENSSLADVARKHGIIGVYNIDKLRLIDEIGRKLNSIQTVHIKIDASLGRQGVMPEELDEFIGNIKKLKFTKIEAIYSHFANIEDTTDFSHAQKQLDVFRAARDKFIAAGYKKIKTHISASSGIMVYEKTNGVSDFVRLGLAMYGMWPSEELREKYLNDFDLRPVIRWVTHVAQVKAIPMGHSIGYGLTYIAPTEIRVAVIPQGYSDGFDRGFSGVGKVLIQGTRCKVLGRVAMNMFVVDVSHLENVSVEDEVVILGAQGGEVISAEELANTIGTINYEITTRIWPKLPRRIV